MAGTAILFRSDGPASLRGTVTPVHAEIPESHRDLIDGPYWAALTTVMPDGQPQTTPVWCNRDGDYLLTNTMLGFRKEKNMRANPKVTVLVYDPRNPLRNIEIRGLVVEMTEEGALEHDDELARLYLGRPDAHFFGDAVPTELEAIYHPVKVTIAPIHVRIEAPQPSPSLSRPRSRRASSTCLSKWKRSNSISMTTPDTLHTLANTQPEPIPNSHRDLLTSPVYGVLSTVMPDGQSQSSLVWVDSDGTFVLTNTELERQKCRNMRANPRVTLLVVDPNRTERWIEVRGHMVEITTKGAVEHADKLTHRYTGKQHFYGDIYPAAQQQRETRVIVRIMPVKVSLDAIFR